MYNSIEIGLKVKELRKKKKLSQKALAKKVGVPQSSLSVFENGKNIFNIEKVGLIAETLDISLDDLLHDYLLKYSDLNTSESFYDTKLKDLLFSLEENQLTTFDNFIDSYLECQLLLKNKS